MRWLVEMDGDSVEWIFYNEESIVFFGIPINGSLSMTDYRTGEGFSIELAEPGTNPHYRFSAGGDDFREVTFHSYIRIDSDTSVWNENYGGLFESIIDLRAKLCCTPQNIFDIFSPEVEEKAEVEVAESGRRPSGAAS